MVKMDSRVNKDNSKGYKVQMSQQEDVTVQPVPPVS